MSHPMFQFSINKRKVSQSHTLSYKYIYFYMPAKWMVNVYCVLRTKKLARSLNRYIYYTFWLPSLSPFDAEQNSIMQTYTVRNKVRVERPIFTIFLCIFFRWSLLFFRRRCLWWFSCCWRALCVGSTKSLYK